MKTLKHLLLISTCMLLSLASCTTLDKTKKDYPIMLGKYVAPNVEAASLPLILEKNMWITNSESSTVSGNYRISEQSTSNGFDPAIEIAKQNDIVVSTDYLYLYQTFYALGLNDQGRKIHTYFRNKK